MAGSKKQVRQRQSPSPDAPSIRQDPNSYYSRTPSWNFNICDTVNWAFTRETVGDVIWTEIIPRLKSWESQTWQDILVKQNKSNHSIDFEKLNPKVRKLIAQKKLESEMLISLRLNGTHRLYGFIVGTVFNVLWYDPDHGDNDTCVCRSHKQHS